MTEENEWDNILHIRTTGRDDSIADLTRYPYEPTDYCVLERLAGSGYFSKRNTLLDYGCGKGRVDFFLAYQTKCHAIGVEYNERLYARAVQNKENALAGGRVSLTLIDATEYAVPASVDRVFFFNPFSVDILRKVIANLLISRSEHPREILLFFYYPSEFYLEYLTNLPRLTLIDLIDCHTNKDSDPREKLMIYQTKGY